MDADITYDTAVERPFAFEKADIADKAVCLVICEVIELVFRVAPVFEIDRELKLCTINMEVEAAERATISYAFEIGFTASTCYIRISYKSSKSVLRVELFFFDSHLYILSTRFVKVKCTAETTIGMGIFTREGQTACRAFLIWTVR